MARIRDRATKLDSAERLPGMPPVPEPVLAGRCGRRGGKDTSIVPACLRASLVACLHACVLLIQIVIAFRTIPRVIGAAANTSAKHGDVNKR